METILTWVKIEILFLTRKLGGYFGGIWCSRFCLKQRIRGKEFFFFLLLFLIFLVKGKKNEDHGKQKFILKIYIESLQIVLS